MEWDAATSAPALAPRAPCRGYGTLAFRFREKERRLYESCPVLRNPGRNGRYALSVARVLQQIIEEPRECSYLPDERARLEVRVMIDVTTTELEEMLSRGWRIR